MKKVFTVFFTFLSVCLCITPAFAKEQNTVIIHLPELIYEEVGQDESGAYPVSDFTVNILVDNLENLKFCKVTVTYDNTILDAMEEIANYPAISEPYIRRIESTENSVIFTFTHDNTSTENDYQAWAHLPFDVITTGKHGLSIFAEAYDNIGNKVDMEIEYDNKLHPAVIDYSHLEFVSFKEENIFQTDLSGNHYGIFKSEITAKEILSTLNNKNAVIKNSDGKILSDDDFVSTKSRVITTYDGYEVDSKYLIISCDVDCDGKVTPADARIVLRSSAYLESLSGLRFSAADVDGNRKITAADARLILRKAAGLE